MPAQDSGLETVDCPYCGANEPVEWGTENGFVAQQCGRCGIVYVSPRPRAELIDRATETGLHRADEGTVDAVGVLRFRRGKTSFFQRRLEKLFPAGELTRRPVRWLDVGSGFGELVASVSTMVPDGSTVRGIDPCAPKVADAQKRGIDVSQVDIRDIDETYDVVSLINVFSHLPDPRAFFKELASRVTTGGSLVIVTGNGAEVTADKYPDPLLLPDHLIFAGEQHVTGLLQELGFDVIAVERYAHFYRDPLPLHLAKNLAKRILNRPTIAWRNDGPFRSLWIRARKRG